MKKQLTFAIVLSAIAVIFLSLYAYGMFGTFRPDGVTIARLVDRYVGEWEGNSRTYRYTYEYVVNDETYTIVKEGVAGKASIGLGNQFTVYYNTQDPTEWAYEHDLPNSDEHSVNLFLGIAFSAFAAFAWFIVLAVWLQIRERRPREYRDKKVKAPKLHLPKEKRRRNDDDDGFFANDETFLK